MRLKGKIAVITGAATGIGLETAKLFVQNGAEVILTDRDCPAGIQAADPLGDAACFFEQDVSDPASWSELESFLGNIGKVPNVFVNNAGILGPKGPQNLESTDISDWRSIQAVNVEGVFLGCKLAVKLMKGGGGNIVNLSSVAGRQSTPDLIAYGASKAAVIHLTKTVASFCKDKNYPIRCNTVQPNPIKTAMGDQLMEQIGGGDAHRGWQAFEKAGKYGGAGEATDIANGIMFLASDEARHVNGAELAIDGGMLAFS